MTNPDLTHELQVAERAARAAGAIVKRYFGTGVHVHYKGVNDPVTIADHEANDLIVDALSREFPSDGLLSEEGIDDGTWRGRERVWMVDPLDGTKDFIRGLAGFSVMIGLCIESRPVLGVVYQPVSGTLFYSMRGRGAHRTDDATGATRRLAVSDVNDLAAIRLVASASHRTETIDRVRAVLGVHDEQNVGSVGLKLALIAEGLRDLYVNPASRSCIWDTCGPEAILVEAGGTLTDLFGRPLDYRGPELRNSHGLVASNGRMHDEIIGRLAELFPDRRADD